MLLLGSLAHLVFLYPHPLKSIVCLEGTLLKSQDYGCSFQEELSHSLAQAGHIMLWNSLNYWLQVCTGVEASCSELEGEGWNNKRTPPK